MHYHLEIITPPNEDVKTVVEKILAPFDENGDKKEEDYSAKHAFWDWWQVGGRYSGNKLLARLGEDRIASFRKLLHDQHITVSDFRAGKPTLSPADQAETVNMLWRDAFPDWPSVACPLFDNYKSDTGDVMKLEEVSEGLACSHVIVAGPNYSGENIEAKFMIQESIWNGVTHCKTAWDGTLAAAIGMALDRIKDYKPEYAARLTPQADWLVVTVDYHSRESNI
jgi:hypothetical protein